MPDTDVAVSVILTEIIERYFLRSFDRTNGLAAQGSVDLA